MRDNWKAGDTGHADEHNAITRRLWSVRDFNAKGDGVTDDSAAFALAIARLPDGSTLHIPAGMYVLDDGLNIPRNISLRGEGTASRLIQRGRVFRTTAHLINYTSPVSATYTAAGQLGATDTTITLDTPAILMPGQEVFLQLGTSTHDPTQPFLCQFNVIASVAGSTITLRVPFGEAIQGSAHRVLVQQTIENVTVENLALESDVNAEPDQCIYIDRCRNVTIRNIHMDHTGSIVNAQSANVRVDNVYVQRARRWGKYAASGNVIGGWGFRNYAIRNLYCADVDGNGIYLEAHGRGAIIENYWYTAGTAHGTNGYGLWVGGGCRNIVVRNAHLLAPYPNYFGIDVQDGADVVTEDIHLYAGTRGVHFLLRHRGTLGYDCATGEMSVYVERKRESVVIALIPGMTQRVALPGGIYARVVAFTNDANAVTSLNFEHGGEYQTALVSGESVNLNDGRLTNIGPNDAYPFNNTAQKAVWVVTGPNVTVNAVLTLAIDYWFVD